MQSSISGQEMINIEQVADQRRTFAIDDEGAHFVEEVRDIDFGRAGGDEAPFLFEIADILSFVASVMCHSMMSSLLDIFAL